MFVLIHESALLSFAKRVECNFDEQDSWSVLLCIIINIVFYVIITAAPHYSYFNCSLQSLSAATYKEICKLKFEQ